MKLLCKCGAPIQDLTDYQENKARFVPDESCESMHEDIDAGVSSWDAAREVMRLMDQCYECSRLYIESHSGSFIAFTPHEETPCGLRKSTQQRRKRLPRQELAAASLGAAPAGSFASKLFAFFSTHCQHLGAIFRDSKDPGRRSSMTALFLQLRVSSTYARLHFRSRSCWARF